MPAYRADRETFTNAVVSKWGEDKTQITRKEVEEICSELNSELPLWLIVPQEFRVARGVYSLSEPIKDSLRNSKSMRSSRSRPLRDEPEPMEFANPKTPEHLQAAITVRELFPNKIVSDDQYIPIMIPNRAEGYVPFGHYNDIRAIVKSKRFYPTYITGLSGNGKTMMAEQVCSELKRECIRVNITKETDEDDLIGGFRLVDGNTVWQDGPVVIAMERGAILLLDEVDLGDAKLMCLQPILEGKAFLIKKQNRVVKPSVGFNIIVTANTKGQGSDDGRFIGTNVMNEAFLERFSITFEQEYPSTKIETEIIRNVLKHDQVSDDEFVDKLVTWAGVIRKSFYEGAVNEVISTRRLVHIAEAYSIFGKDRKKAIELCINRFDKETKEAFLGLYLKLDDKTETAATPKEPVNYDQPYRI